MEQAEIRRALTQATGKVAVDPVPQGTVHPQPAEAQASEQQQRSGAQGVGIAMTKMNDHDFNNR